MKTRQQYLNGECTHREFYEQFVNEEIKQAILNRYSIIELKKAYEENNSFNSIRLSSWDGMASFLRYDHELCNKIKEHGDFLTNAGAVCILKEAAKQIID